MHCMALSVVRFLCSKSFLESLLLLSPHKYAITCLTCLDLTMSVKRRNMLHLTAKSTQFGKKTLTSWLVEAAGTVPIQRRKDCAKGVANNDASMAKLTQVRGLANQSEIF